MEGRETSGNELRCLSESALRDPRPRIYGPPKRRYQCCFRRPIPLSERVDGGDLPPVAVPVILSFFSAFIFFVFFCKESLLGFATRINFFWVFFGYKTDTMKQPQTQPFQKSLLRL